MIFFVVHSFVSIQSKKKKKKKIMYAAHSKNINRHKSFHPLTGQNLEKIEKKYAEVEQKESQIADRKATLRRERDDELIADLEDASAGIAATKGPRVDWVFAAEKGVAQTQTPTSSGAVRMAPAAETTKTTTSSSLKPSTVVAAAAVAPVATTGAVTTAEALKTRQEIERLRKLKNDPLSKVRQHRDDVVASAARGFGGAPAAGVSGAPAGNDIQQRLQALLSARAAGGQR
jgi:hypothetical protein